jgi:hypothetical protein
MAFSILNTSAANHNQIWQAIDLPLIAEVQNIIYIVVRVQTPLRNIAKNTGLNEATAVDGRSTASLLQQ